MPTVMCRPDSAGFAAEMIKMRIWLDRHQNHVENFGYYKLMDNVIVVQLDFTDESDACRFVAEFDGETVLYSSPGERMMNDLA